MINQSLSGSPRRRDGPLKKVPIPRSIDELINVKRLAIHFGNFCTSIMHGIYVIGTIVNIKPTYYTESPKSWSRGEKVGSS